MLKISKKIIIFLTTILLTSCAKYYVPPQSSPHAQIGSINVGFFNPVVAYILTNPINCTNPQLLYNSSHSKVPVKIEANKLTTLLIMNNTFGFTAQFLYVSFYPLPNKTYLLSFNTAEDENSNTASQFQLINVQTDKAKTSYIPTDIWKRQVTGIWSPTCKDIKDERSLLQSKKMKSIITPYNIPITYVPITLPR